MTICEEVKKGYETAKRDGLDFEVSEPRAFYSSESIDDFPMGNQPGYIDLFRTQSKGLTGEERGREYSKAEAFLDYANQLCQNATHENVDDFEKKYLQAIEAAMVNLILAGYPECAEAVNINPTQKIDSGLFVLANNANCVDCEKYANLVVQVIKLENLYKL